MLAPPLPVDVGTMDSAFFSASLTSSQAFTFNGQTVDFKELVPHSVTFDAEASFGSAQVVLGHVMEDFC